jgi:hypothetical protein
MHATHLVAMHTTDQNGALARLCSLGDCHRHIAVLSGGHLHALKIQKVLLAGFQVVDVECADNLFPLDCIARVIAGLGLQNSMWSLVVIYPTFTIPFCTWLLMGFFKSLPVEKLQPVWRLRQDGDTAVASR